MTVLNPAKLHVNFADNVSKTEFALPRCYTLTHSDRTGDLFLTIGQTYNRPQISGWYTRFMRDEVLANWLLDESINASSLHVYCHVSGGLILGSAGWRYNIFNHHMRQVLQAFRFGDRRLLEVQPELEEAAVIICYKAKESRYNKTVKKGQFGDYHLERRKSDSPLS